MPAERPVTGEVIAKTDVKPLARLGWWVKRAGRSAFETYFTLDPRSLGVCRLGLGALLLYDLARRIPGLATWYSNEGLLPNHIALQRPAAEYMFSILFAASRPWETAVLFVLMGLVFSAFMAGYRTRLFHALSLASTVSLHSRAIFLENGGDVVLNLLCAWTLFLPMGARFSIDAVKKSLAARREQTVTDLNDRSALPPRQTRPVRSLVVLAILLQLAAIYYLNALHKTGWTWRQGKAVHYVFFQERMVTWLGLLARPYLLPELTRRMTYTTWNIELLAAPLILNPFFKVWSRRLMMLLLPGLHLAFASVLNLGQFSFNMIGFYPLFLGPRDWELARRLGPAAARARTVHVGDRSSVAWFWARLLVRLDSFERLEFATLDDETRGSWAVENPTNGARATGALAVAECLAALPCGRPLAAMVRIAPARWLAGTIATTIAWLAKARGVERTSCADGAVRGPSPAARWFGRRAAELREVAIVIVAIALGSQVLTENKAIAERYKPAQPKWMQQVVSYPRLFQGWGMFSPDVPTGERMLYIDALTITGRHVDPFNEAGARTATLPVEQIPEHMQQDEFWCDFTNRVPDNDTYWPALKAWVFGYPNRTKRPDDRILSFEAKVFEQENPSPGERSPRNFRTKVMLRGWEGQ
jgi:hypothetical protein